MQNFRAALARGLKSCKSFGLRSDMRICLQRWLGDILCTYLSESKIMGEGGKRAKKQKHRERNLGSALFKSHCVFLVKRTWKMLNDVSFSTPFVWEWVASSTIYNNHTLKPFKKLGLEFQRAKKLASKLLVHSVYYAAILIHIRRALSSTITNSHQEPVSGQACNPPDPQFIFLSFGEEFYNTEVYPFPQSMQGVVFTACVVSALPFCYVLSAVQNSIWAYSLLLCCSNSALCLVDTSTIFRIAQHSMAVLCALKLE